MKKMLLLASFLFVLSGCGQKAQESTENKPVEIKKEVPAKKEIVKEEVKEEVNNEEAEDVSVKNNSIEETTEKNQGFSDAEKEQAKKMVKDFFDNYVKLSIKNSEKPAEYDKSGKLLGIGEGEEAKFVASSNFVTKNFSGYYANYVKNPNNHDPITCSQDIAPVKSVTLINQNDTNLLLFSVKMTYVSKVYVVKEGSGLKIDKILCN